MKPRGSEGGSVKGMNVALCAREIEEVQPLADILTKFGCHVQIAESPDELYELLGRQAIDVVLAHVCPSRLHFLDILGRPQMPPVVPLLCHADRNLYLESLRRGAYDCVPLPVHESELVRVLLLAATRQKHKSSVAAIV